MEQNHTASFTWGHCPVPPVVTYLGRTTVIMKSSSNVLKLLWEESEKWKEEIFRMKSSTKAALPFKSKRYSSTYLRCFRINADHSQCMTSQLLSLNLSTFVYTIIVLISCGHSAILHQIHHLSFFHFPPIICSVISPFSLIFSWLYI